MSIKDLLVEDWKKAHKFLSVQVAVVAGALATASDYIPVIHDNLPEGWSKFAIAGILLARLIHQGPRSEQ